jgi:deazaflavin-dependent oxidoreductase (nitroreductase family)
MESWPISGDKLRAMYAGGRADPAARRLARLWASVFSLGLAPRRWVTLEVAGRRSGQPTRFPLGLARLDGRWYLVSMLGERCNWVKNVRAADGLVTLRHGRAVRRRLVEVPASERPPILRQYLRQVPGARPHIPVSQHAGLADFAAIAPGYPVFLVTSDRPPRRRRLRWIGASAAAIVIVVIGAIAAFVKFGPSAPALALPAGTVRAPAGPLDGTWQVAAGSRAGFRVKEYVIGLSNYVGGTTQAVTGTIVIARNTVTSAAFRVNLTTVKVNGKAQPQFALSLGTRHHPVATLALAKPVLLDPALASGGTIALAAAGRLTMNGFSRPVTVMLTARRDGGELQAAGAIPVTFGPWGIREPGGLGFLGSLADNGEADFVLILRRQ